MSNVIMQACDKRRSFIVDNHSGENVVLRRAGDDLGQVIPPSGSHIEFKSGPDAWHVQPSQGVRVREFFA